MRVSVYLLASIGALIDEGRRDVEMFRPLYHEILPDITRSRRDSDLQTVRESNSTASPWGFF